LNEAKVDAAKLRAYVEEILTLLGARPGHASRVAEALVDADESGHASHGVRQLPYYADQIQRGELDVARDWEIVRDSGSLVVVDGHYGFGQVIAADTARLASDRAKTHQVAAVAVRHANHIGRLGEYTELIAARGQLGLMLVTCEGSFQHVAPYGGTDRRLTNNPISLVVPGPDHPVMLDMALSAVAESRVLHAAERHAPVPEGWVLDRDGNPSTSPDDYLDGGSLVPVGGVAGGHKGYALIVLVELIVGMLTGGPICGPEERRFSNGYVLICIDPGSATRPADVAALRDWVTSTARRSGVEDILMPGDAEVRHRTALDGAVRLDRSTLALLDDLALSVGLRNPL
jgi:hydroxycarboxylate dehydrogenase B